jgi:release factor glutamine methyltransferase
MDRQPPRHDWTIGVILESTTAVLKRHAIDSPRLTAEILLAWALTRRRLDLYRNHDRPLAPEERHRFESAVQRRLNREPVAYITGAKEFFSLPLAVSPAVLIPRPETEFLVEKAIALIDAGASHGQKILELGTGSGAIVLALASQRPDHFYAASDISPKALAVARQNAAAHVLGHKIHFFCGSWFTPLHPGKGVWDLIVANPPYIASQVIASLEAEVRCHEPRLALDGGTDGLKSLGVIIAAAPEYLAAGGWLVLEIGFDQADPVRRLLAAKGQFDRALVIKDLAGSDRVALARRRL